MKNPYALTPSPEQPEVNVGFIETLAMISRLLDDEPDVQLRGTRTNEDKDGAVEKTEYELTCLWEYVELVFQLNGRTVVGIYQSRAAQDGRFMELRDTFAAITGYCVNSGVGVCNRAEHEA